MNSLNRIVVVALLVLSLTTAASATVWHVPGDVPTIAAALALTVPGDVVELAPGTYLEHDLIMTSGVTLRCATGQAADAVIDAQGLGRVLYCDMLLEPVTIEGLTITGGLLTDEDATARGAGIFALNTQLILSNCAILDNEAWHLGGGLYITGGGLEASHCRFEGNIGEHGGGGAICGDNFEGFIDHCRFEANRGIDGAGIYLRHASPDITWCTFASNDGWFFGGGALLGPEVWSFIDHCTFVDNEALSGTAIMTMSDTAPVVTNCLFAFGRDGASLHIDGPSSIDLSCCLFYGAEDGTHSGNISDPIGVGGNIGLDPLLCGLETGDYTLAANSPALPTNNDCGVLMGAWDEGCEADLTDALPGPGTIRLTNYPNPFNPSTTIVFNLSEAQTVSLCVLDLGGHTVCEILHRDRRDAGQHAVAWDGRDLDGRTLPSGTYLARLSFGTTQQVRTMTLLK